jgi:hypothetical protein
MSKLREIIHDERQRRQGLARGPRIWMWVIWEPILSPAGDRIVGKRQTAARAEIFGDPHRRTWEQHDETFEAFEKRVKAVAADVARTQDFPPSER